MTQTHRLSPGTIVLLTVPPLMWACNAVLGRMAAPLVPPMTLNLLRWAVALVLLLPLGGWVLRPAGGLWRHWRRFSALGLLGVGCYNAFQYLALKTSSPINVTLVASSMPLWMLAVGALFFGQRITRRQVVGAALSIAGVLVVLSHGEWAHLRALRLVPGDVYVLLAALAWPFYSWLLIQRHEPEAVRANWAAFLLAQVVPGVAWSGLFAAGEWALGAPPIQWSATLVAMVLFIAAGPAVLAFRCWGAGVQRSDPSVAAFFVNLTPLLAALLSVLLLGETQAWHHALAFVLIVGSIAASALH
jgi:drug/metabolite transporter (DMT)-like permease